MRYQADRQALFATESVTQALRQLEVYGHEGLPVLSADGHQIPGWVTAPDVLTAIGRQITTEQARTARAQPAPTTVPPAGIDPAASADPATRIPRSLRSPSPLTRLPPGSTPVMGLRGHRPCRPGPDPTLAPGDRVSLLALAPTAHPNPIMATNTTCASRRYPPPCVANEPPIYKKSESVTTVIAPDRNGTKGPYPMKPYTFLFRNGKVIVAEECLSFSPALRDRTLRRLHWSRADIVAIAVQPLPKKRCDVEVRRQDGEIRRFQDIDVTAAEMEEEFTMHGYRRRS